MDLKKLKSEYKDFKKQFKSDYVDSRKDFQDFINLYPFKENPDQIDSLTPDDIFNPGNVSFLYYIEFKLKDFGMIRVGSAQYAYNAQEQIDEFKNLLKIVVDDSVSIADKVDALWDDIKFWGGDRHIAKKIIYCYNADKILPIYNTDHLEYFAELFNENYDSQANKFDKDYEELDVGQKFEYLNQIILEDFDDLEIDNVSFMHFLYNYYPPENESLNIWKITPGEGPIREYLWNQFQEHSVIGIGWFDDQFDYSDFNSLDDIKKAFIEYYGKPKNTSAKMIWDFVHNIKIGDIIVANDGLKECLGIGVIESEYISPNNPLNPVITADKKKSYGEYVHFRKVNWHINDKISFKSNTFDQKTITRLSADKWDTIKKAYIAEFPEYDDFLNGKISPPKSIAPKSTKILKELFKEYEIFYKSEDGQKHSQKYDLERSKVKKYYDLIEKEPDEINNVSNPPINFLLPIKEPSVAPAAVGSITAYGYTDEDLPDLTRAVHKLIKDLIVENNPEKQKEIILSFKSGPYAKGFRSAILTPTLYYMNPEFLLLNKKTGDTYHFISKLFGKEDKISVELTDYIENNKKLKKLLEDLSEIFPDLTFEKFDEFCHWMCYSQLGNYARDPEKYAKWLEEHFPTQSEYGIRELFETIFKKYYNARINKEPVKDHELSQVFSKIPKTMEKIVNIPSITDYKHDYRAYSKFQGKGSFFKHPWTLLYDDKFEDNKNFIYIILIFPEKVEGAYLSLNLNWGHFGNIPEEVKSTWTEAEKNACLRKRASELRSKIISESPVDFEFDFKNHPWQDTTIIGKYYNANDLPGEEVIVNDLIKLTELHNKLIDVFMEEETPVFPSFSEYLQEKNFLYTPEMVENFLLSLLVKPFVILTGSSGTGKTKIAQLFAEYLKGKNMADYVIIPVGANWTENRHLMGFYNVITRNYESTPALDLITDAHNNPDKTYFLILDEMNLSHVERYFSDFLSAMESGKEIELYSKHKAEAIKNKIIPQKLKIPDNLLVVGTVNVDETTYMFSPKVLDRANTIEFSTYPANDYIMCTIEHHDLEGNMDLLENPLSYLNNRDINIAQLKDLLIHVQIKNGDNLWTTLAREIHTFQDTLKMAGFDFGFRVINEILRFMYMAWLYEGSPPVWDNWERYFDAQIMQKMLPKIHGSQRELEVLLEELVKLTYNGPYNDTPWVSLTLDEDKCKYPSSALKIQSLGRSLQEKRYASFTG